MIIKSHVRGGFTSAAAYLAEVGANEYVRPVEFNDHGARNLNEAFSNMWAVARTTRATKPLHHVSINPHKDERLTNTQVLLICAHLEKKYGYASGQHQRVIVEHIKDGRQHFHVMWNRVSLKTGRPVWPGHHWNKSKQAAREIETELGLKRPVPRRAARARKSKVSRMSAAKTRGGGHGVRRPTFADRASIPVISVARLRAAFRASAMELFSIRPVSLRRAFGAAWGQALTPFQPSRLPRRRLHAPLLPSSGLAPAMDADDKARRAVLAWAWANDRWDVLALYGICVPLDL